ncbi:MAG: hypothetical protein NTV51_10520 [Verrucomicrobia bacterium]|nr:hypothetical protein [Verrucomicrobiota bacterium]
MLNPTDTLVATDPFHLVDLCYDEKKQVYLSYRRATPSHRYLKSDCLADLLQDVVDYSLISIRLDLHPEVPGLSRQPSLIIFVSGRERVVIAYVPMVVSHEEATALFNAFPKLPLIVTENEILANRDIHTRMMCDPSRN